VSVSTAEATCVVVSALLAGGAVGWCLGWFRGYTCRDMERRP
jgi:NhaP-type Na+/H+ or K+/H+ antiporter